MSGCLFLALMCMETACVLLSQWRSYYGLKYSTNLPIILVFKVCIFCHKKRIYYIWNTHGVRWYTWSGSCNPVFSKGYAHIRVTLWITFALLIHCVSRRSSNDHCTMGCKVADDLWNLLRVKCNYARPEVKLIGSRCSKGTPLWRHYIVYNMAEPEPINSVGNIKEAGFEDKLRIKMACRPKPMIE